MILIDTLSYTSRLRQVNPGEKFAFSMLTLIFCIVSRSLAVAGVVLAATGFLTVCRAGSLSPGIWAFLGSLLSSFYFAARR